MSSDFNTGQVLFADQQNKVKLVPVNIPFTTTTITRDFLQEFGMHMVRLVIDNNDGTNPLTFRVEPFGQLQTIPISTRGELTDEIHSFLQINPNAVTGQGLAVAYLAPIEEVARMGLIAS